jgi:mono/diheme cytochrome c family protein
MRLKKKHLVLAAILCSILFGVTCWTVYTEYDRQWKRYQQEFNKYRNNTVTAPKDVHSPVRIRQIWLPEIHVTDRCTTCHLGADSQDLNNATHPFRAHSGDYLKQHPVEEFGCVVCHAGEGEALTVSAAHGDDDNWLRKLLRGNFVQSSCRKCHPLRECLPITAEMPGGAVLIEGWRLFRQYNCLGCHKLSDYKRPERIGPSLSFIGRKVQRSWLFNWLKNPKAYLSQTKMPRYRLNEEDISCIADYLLSFDSGSRRKLSPVQKLDTGGLSHRMLIMNGERFVNDLGCLGCHKIGDKGVAFGPDFSNIGNKVRPEWLSLFLNNPKAHDSETIIPDFQIPQTEIPGIVAYLMSLKSSPVDASYLEGANTGAAVEEEPSHDAIQKGEKLVKELGCRGCHDIEGVPFRYSAPDLDGIGRKRMEELFWGNSADVEKSLINWLILKVSDPGRFDAGIVISRMPDYGFSKDEAEAIVTFLLSLTKETMPPDYVKVLNGEATAVSRGSVVMEKYNCRGCHTINKVGGLIGPDLTYEGKRCRPEWLYNFLKKPRKIRPSFIVQARMLNFSMTDREVSDVIDYFSFLSGQPYPFQLDIKMEVYTDDIRAGEKLYEEVFACNACHRMDGKGGEIGPDHTDIASRLKRDWIRLWLENPQKIKPDVRMPRFTFKEWEFDALTDYLMTRGRYRFVQPSRN